MIKRELSPVLWGRPGGHGIRMEKVGAGTRVWGTPPDLFISGGQHWLLDEAVRALASRVRGHTGHRERVE